MNTRCERTENKEIVNYTLHPQPNKLKTNTRLPHKITINKIVVT